MGIFQVQVEGWEVSLITGDCRQVMGRRAFDMILADPPYGDTSIVWDKRVSGWLPVAYAALKKTGSMWVFGSMRFFMLTHSDFRRAGFRVAQDVVWEKHNGSNFLADRFRRVHEHAVQFIRKDTKWGDVYNDPQVTMNAVARTVTRNKSRPPHLGAHGPSTYESEDGGPKLMRSVIAMRSCHGRAIHPTEKPVELLSILIRTSCPAKGLVGDFFAGSGSGGEASAGCGRRYLGSELDEKMAQAARDRINQLLPMGGA